MQIIAQNTWSFCLLQTFVEFGESRTLCRTCVTFSLSLSLSPPLSPLSLSLSLSLSLLFARLLTQVDRWKRAKLGKPVARISGGIPNRRGNPRHLEIDGVRFRCNWRHRVRATSPTSSPTSRSRMYIGYIENVSRDGTKRDERGRIRVVRGEEIRVHPSLVMRTGTSPWTCRLLFARSITVTYGWTVSKGWIEMGKEGERREENYSRVYHEAIEELKSSVSLYENLFFILLLSQYILRCCSSRC